MDDRNLQVLKKFANKLATVWFVIKRNKSEIYHSICPEMFNFRHAYWLHIE